MLMYLYLHVDIRRCIRPVTGMYHYTDVFVHNLYLHVDVQGASKKTSLEVGLGKYYCSQ